MADTQTMSSNGGDLFDGLGLDYNFLEGSGASSGPQSDAAMASSDASTVVPGGFMASLTAPDDQMLFDHDLPTASSMAMGAGGPTTSEKDDLLTPLTFSFNANTATTNTPSQPYHVAAQHKHKRVRSNPDVIQGFGMPANMAPSLISTPVLPSSGGMGFPKPRAQRRQQQAAMGPMQMDVPTTPIPFNAGDNGQSSQENFQEMDEFLKELSWSELTSEQQQSMDAPTSTTSNGSTTLGDDLGRTIEASPVAYRSQRIQEGVNELKMKRKRPVNHHSRHHSNPVDLLHNLDQFRILAQQTKQQPPQASPPAGQNFANPFASFQDPTVFPTPPAPNMQLMGLQTQTSQQFQFQVPPQIASGAVHSLHGRRSSLGSNLPPRAAARRRGANRSTGLSMDMSQMNLEFLSVPEEPGQPSMGTGKPQRSPPRRSASAAAGSGKKADDGTRKLYKCGRCGQPKVGHVCTMPDQRNNWTQVDLEVTKGLKVMRINCHIMPVKSKWVTQCEDHEPPQLASSGEEVEAEPMGV